MIGQSMLSTPADELTGVFLANGSMLILSPFWQFETAMAVPEGF